MATLSVFKFSDPAGADQALEILQRLQREHLLRIEDAAVVSWPRDSKGPKTRQLVDARRAGALSGGFWGFLLGMIFFAPLLGLTVGAAAGAYRGSLSDYGIDDTFIESTRSKVTSGTSALFLLSTGAVAEKVYPEIQALNPELISTNLPVEQQERLRELFAGHQTTA